VHSNDWFAMNSAPSGGFGPATASKGHDRSVKVSLVLDSSQESSRYCSATCPELWCRSSGIRETRAHRPGYGVQPPGVTPDGFERMSRNEAERARLAPTG
jgi:hypothetical protein